ncbi:MAG: PPOX class F420-dependent oxidoreductase [Steroidobacteraceae bacterium]
MPATLDQYQDLLSVKKPLAALATVMPDGTPQVTPVWFDFDGKRLRVNTARGRVKERNMREGARVALMIVDPDNPYRYVQVRGRVALATESGADEHIDSLTRKYLGKDQYPYRGPGEVRVRYEIEPVSVQGMS